MEPFKTFRGRVAPLDRANVDTDQIIPKQFLKSIARTGFGESLFFDWRYLADGTPDPAFVLNEPRYRGAAILAARNNFGCGSSREHAVWAVAQYGFRAVIAPRLERAGEPVPAFADIFRNNCAKNGVLTIELTVAQVDRVFEAACRPDGVEMTVDLGEQKVVLHAGKDETFRFEIDPAVKERLIGGLDDIGLTLKREAEIRAFESRHDTQLSR